jgi:hypothetical protein
VSERGKRSRSVRENHDTLDVQHQVSMRHSAHLRVIDLCHRGRRRPDDASPKVGTSTPSSGFIIDTRRILLRIGSLSGGYIRTVKIVQGILVVTSILRPLAGASRSSSSASIPDPDSSNDYPEIGVSVCGEPAESDRFIYMVTPES